MDSKTEPLVSVGLPCYNRPEMLKRAIDCMLNQTYKNIELLISNDCSPNPEVYRLLDEYAAKDSRIRLWHQPVDLAVYGNYYFVQSHATGPYFMYLQDDDWWEPDSIELMVKDLEAHPDNALSIGRSARARKDFARNGRGIPAHYHSHCAIGGVYWAHGRRYGVEPHDVRGVGRPDRAG